MSVLVAAPMPTSLARFPSEEQPATPLFDGPMPETKAPKRPRGRPIGSKAQVIREVRALGVHHFAFVRSSLLAC